MEAEEEPTGTEVVHAGGPELSELPSFRQLAEPMVVSMHSRMVEFNRESFSEDDELQSLYEDMLASTLHGFNPAPGLEHIYAIAVELYVHQWALLKQRQRIGQRIEAEIPEELRDVIGPISLPFLDIKTADILVKRCQGLLNSFTKASSSATTELAVRRRITGICVNHLRDVLSEKVDDQALIVEILVETVERISRAMDDV